MKRQLMAEQWNAFALRVLPPGCSAVQQQERCAARSAPARSRFCFASS